MDEYKKYENKPVEMAHEPAVAYDTLSITRQAASTILAEEKRLDAKRDEYRQKFRLPDALIRLIGSVPSHTDEEREKAKEAYMMEKYGRR